MEIKRKLFPDATADDFLDLPKILEFLKKPTAVLLAFFILLQPLAFAFAQEAESEISEPIITESPQEFDAPTAKPSSNPEASEIPSVETPDATQIPSPDSTQAPNPNVDQDLATEPADEDVLPQPPNEEDPVKEEGEEDPKSEDPEESYEGPIDPKAKEAGQKLASIDESTGAAVIDYDIIVPPGRNGMQPNLKLTYNSQNSEDGSPFGFGWSINIPYIERLNKAGIDRFYSTSSPLYYFSSSLDGELATSTATSTAYIAKVDNGSFNSYTFASDTWLMKDKNGTQYKFGYASTSQQTNASSSSQVYKWTLEEIRDKNDNYIKYTYFKDSGQIYPDTIYYTGTGTTDGIFKVEFLRQTRTDAFPSYKTGFAVQTKYRIYEIKTYVNSDVVRKYALSYTTGNNGVRSMLESLQESGYVEGSSTAATLPSTSFTYETTDAGFSSSGAYSMPTSTCLSFEFGDRLADVNGDGLVDYLSSWDGPAICGQNSNNQVYLKQADGTWSLSQSFDVPVVFYTGSSNYPVQIMDDINGDGLLDFGSSGVGSSEVYINNGSNWVLDNNWVIPVDWSENKSRTKDLNGDGLPDIHVTQHGVIIPRVYLNLGHNWSSASSSTFVAPFSELGPEYILDDINNDGVTDRLHSETESNCSTSTKESHLGDGIGNWVSSSSTTPPIIFAGDNTYCAPYERGVILIDIDGDGLNDMFQAAYGGGMDWFDALANSGQGWTAKASWEADLHFVINNLPTFSRVTDFNADGLSDFWDGTNPRINLNKKADLLKKITLPEGGTSEIVYKPSTQYLTASSTLANSELPLIIYAVSQIVNKDASATSTTETYSYRNGKYTYRNAFERRFAGFGEIHKTDAAGNITKTFFHQGNTSASSTGEFADNFWKIGKPYRVEQYDSNNNLFRKTINKWDSSTSTYNSNAGFVYLAQTVTYDYNGDSSHKDKAEGYTYSTSTGNLTEKMEWGEVTGSDDGSFTDTGSDKFTTSYTYATSSTSTVMSLLSSQSTLDQSSNKVRETKNYYDTLPFGIVDKGNLTKQEFWTASSTYVDVEKTYNSFGLIISEKDPRDKTISYTYDSNNLYPATVTNPVSHVSRYLYDYSSGKVATTTDPNGNNFFNRYDGLDRLIEQKQPDPSATSTLLTALTLTYTDSTGNVNVKESRFLDTSTSTDSYIYFDSLGRKKQERKEAEGSNYAVKDYVYNNVGLLQKETLPYFSSGTASTTATSTAALFINYFYDALYRLSTTTNAVGTTTSVHSGWQINQTDARGKEKILYKDAYGNLIQVNEHNNAVPDLAEIYSHALYSDANLVSYYRLEGNGNDSKGSNHGTSTSVTYSAGNGKFGQGGGFDGSSSSIDLGNPASLQLTGTTTIHFWLKDTGSYTNPGAIVMKSDDNSNRSFAVYFDSTSVTANFSSDGAGNNNFIFYKTVTWDQQWHMWDIVFVPNGASSTHKIYKDSILQSDTVSSSSFSGTTTYNSLSNIFIGQKSNGGWNMNGKLDDAAIFNRQLTTSELEDLYQQTSTIFNTYTTLYEYNGNNLLTKITDANGNVRNFTYDGLGRRLTAQDLHSVGDATYGSYTYFYDDAGNLTQKVDPKSQTINYTYDDINRQLTEDYTGSAGAEVTYTYDTCTQGKSRLCASSSTSVSISNVYDALGRIGTTTSTIDSTAYVTAHTYDRQGNQLTITSPDDSQIKYLYNSAGLLEAVQRKELIDIGYANVVSNFDYSPAEQIKTIAYANGVSTTNTYDSSQLYRLSNKSTTYGTSSLQSLAYTYDSNGNITQIVDSSGTHSAKTVNYEYDDLNRLISASSTSASYGSNYDYSYTYDALGNILTRTENGTTTTYTYATGTAAYLNPHAALIIGNATSTYDNNGNLLANITGNATTTTYTWDYNNRLTQYYFLGASTTLSTFSGAGDGSIYHQNSSWSTAHDAATGTAANYTDTTLNVRTGKTGDGGLYRIERAFLPFNTASLPDNAQILEARLKTYAGSKTNADNDGDDFITVIQTSQPSTTALTTADYDLAGAISNPTEGIDTTERKDITSITTGQYLTFTLNSTGKSWASTTGYTLLGLREGHDVLNTAFTGSSNQYNGLTIRTSEFTGTSTDPILEITYATSSVPTTATYSYDPDGFRVKETVATTSSASTYYPTKFYSTNGTTPTKSIFLPDGTLIATVVGTGTTTTVSYIHTDHLGGTNVATNDSGEVVQLLDYYPYGDRRLDEQSGHDEKRKFASYRFDADTGLNYLNQRYLNTSNARFLSQDPVFLDLNRDLLEDLLADPQQWNSYSYARNNPLFYIDPTGLTTEINANTGVVTNVIDDDNTVIYAYPYVGDKRAAGPPTIVGYSAAVDTFQVGATIHVGVDKTEDVYKAVVPQWELSPITAYKSMPYGKYDIKNTWGLSAGDGYIFEGKYMTVQNLGDVLAGINAHAQGVSFDTFQRMAGAVQQGKGITGIIKAFFGKEYGPAPRYGENDIQYRASLQGYNDSYKNFSKWWYSKK